MKDLALICAGMAYGDESKGATVDYLCRKYKAATVVRFNGGPNAGHNVVLDNGTHHTFSQFGAGSFVPEVKTHLSQFTLLNPISQMAEAEALIRAGVTDIWQRTTIHKDCVIITPYHTAVNRELERRRGHRRHGSVGRGIGVAREISLNHPDITIRAGDLKKQGLLFDKLMRQVRVLPVECEPLIDIGEMMDFFLEWPGQVVDSFDPSGVTVFEGAQGFLLDETHGVSPYNTWTDCTFNNAVDLLKGFNGTIRKIGCFRTYFTRHGAGPFTSEVTNPPLGYFPAEMHNASDEWQGGWRVGLFDDALAAQAIETCRPDEISLSHCESQVFPAWDCTDSISGVPITIRAYGPTSSHRKEAE